MVLCLREDAVYGNRLAKKKKKACLVIIQSSSCERLPKYVCLLKLTYFRLPGKISLVKSETHAVASQCAFSKKILTSVVFMNEGLSFWSRRSSTHTVIIEVSFGSSANGAKGTYNAVSF